MTEIEIESSIQEAIQLCQQADYAGCLRACTKALKLVPMLAQAAANLNSMGFARGANKLLNVSNKAITPSSLEGAISWIEFELEAEVLRTTPNPIVLTCLKTALDGVQYL